MHVAQDEIGGNFVLQSTELGFIFEWKVGQLAPQHLSRRIIINIRLIGINCFISLCEQFLSKLLSHFLHEISFFTVQIDKLLVFGLQSIAL